MFRHASTLVRNNIQPAQFTLRPILTQQQRFYFPLNQPRTWVQKYDDQIVQKYPRVLEVIQGSLSKSALSTTERSALYVATYKTGVSGARRIRKRERKTNFLTKVDALVTAWKDIEHQQKKVNLRADQLRTAKANKLSTWHTRVNGVAPQIV